MERETVEKLRQEGERFNILSKPGSVKEEKISCARRESRKGETSRGLRENTVDELKYWRTGERDCGAKDCLEFGWQSEVKNYFS